MSANSRELALARRALKTAITHLSQARGLTCMPDATRDDVLSEMTWLGWSVATVEQFAAKADAHLAAKVASRRKR